MFPARLQRHLPFQRDKLRRALLALLQQVRVLKHILSALALASLGTAACAQERPVVHIMTALPLFWGDGDIASVVQGQGPRSPALVSIEAGHQLVPIDLLRTETLGPVRHLILAQPPALRPEELVDLDQWVRAGGQLLIFADPDLRWPTSRAIGDPQRPPTQSLLTPLLRHWGLELVARDRALETSETVTIAGHKAVLVGAGRWTPQTPDCAVEVGGVMASCKIEKGRVLLVADADMLDDRLWAATATDNRPAILALVKRLNTRN